MSKQSQPVVDSVTHVLSQVDPCELVRKSVVLSLIDSMADRFRKTRIENGWHDGETDRWRREKYEVTVAKIQALTMLRIDLSEAESENLTGRKSILDLLERERKRSQRKASEMAERSATAETSNGQECWSFEFHRADAVARTLAELIQTISGNAGKQPVTGENPDSTGKIPVTSPETLPSFLAGLSSGDLHALSEATLDELSTRLDCGPARWAVVDGLRAVTGRMERL